MSEVLTPEQVEDLINDFAHKYAWNAHGIPKRGIRVILAPGVNRCIVTRGPTAIIRMGLRPEDRGFVQVLRSACDLVARHHMYETFAIETTAYIMKRDDEIRRFTKVHGFDPKDVPLMLPAEDVLVRYFSRVEVVHRDTGIREIMEYEESHGQNLHTITEVAKSRLARRVHEKLNPEPWELPVDHPDWVAKTA